MVTNKLEILKDNLIAGKDNTIEHFVLEVCECINDGKWIFCPCTKDEKGTKLTIYNNHEKYYIALYSSEKRKKIASDMVVIDINKIIDVLFANGNCSGIVFDIEDNPIYIERELINNYSNRKDPRLQIKDWGKGIPEYNQEDIMTDNEIFDMGMNIIRNMLIKENYSIIQIINNRISVVNYVVQKNNEIYFVCIETAIAPVQPQLSLKKIDELKKCAQKNEKILYASVSFGSSDEVRFNKKLALIGDGYYCNFTGFENI